MIRASKTVFVASLLAAAGAVGTVATSASAQQTVTVVRRSPAPREYQHFVPRVGIGLEVGFFGTPNGHGGIPLSEETRLPIAGNVRWQYGRFTALEFGIGIPQRSLGLATWVGHEFFIPVVVAPHGIVSLDLYTTPGVQLGVSGPDWFARHQNVYTGYDQFHGPAAFALRGPVGVRLRWADGRFDTYAQAVPLLLVTPGVDFLFEATAGIRVNF